MSTHLEINSIQIFRIDLAASNLEAIAHTQFGTDFNDYLKGLITIITSRSSGRSFVFRSDTTEVRSQIPRLLIPTDFEGASTIIANRLLQAEQDAQEKMAHMQIEIQKGIVIQAVVNDGGVRRFILCKADHNEFLDELSFRKAKGLPIKKRVFKAFSCSIIEKADITDVMVFDTNPTLSKYWWNDFLELNKVHSDEDNTENAFDAIDKSVIGKLKVDYPQDYTYLRNSCIRYFRSKESFDMSNFLDEAIGDYEPYNPKLKIDELKKAIRELPSRNARKPFDEQFTIVKSKIKARFLNTIPLTAQIDLKLKEDVPDLDRVITAYQDQDGAKYVRIRSEQGYKYFSDRARS